MITIAQLLQDAHDTFDEGYPPNYRELAVGMAEGILELLAEADPCGWESPDVIVLRPGDLPSVRVPETWPAIMPSEDARHLARMLLRAADKADNQ